MYAIRHENNSTLADMQFISISQKKMTSLRISQFYVNMFQMR